MTTLSFPVKEILTRNPTLEMLMQQSIGSELLDETPQTSSMDEDVLRLEIQAIRRNLITLKEVVRIDLKTDPGFQALTDITEHVLDVTPTLIRRLSRAFAQNFEATETMMTGIGLLWYTPSDNVRCVYVNHRQYFTL